VNKDLNYSSADIARQQRQGVRTRRWRDKLIRDVNRNPRGLLANAAAALRTAPEWADVFAYDEFALCTRITGAPPWQNGRVGAEWSDHEDRLTAEWLQCNGIFVSSAIAGEAIATVARDKSVHPVRDYLGSLIWDGTSRIENWLHFYCGVEQSILAQAFGARWLISAVARIYVPGCKADCCLILEGKQGIGKSSVLRVLGSPWYTDDLTDLGSKDACLQLRGVWIVEISELASFRGAEANRIKAFISRQVDRYRPPYGRRPIEVPRQCVFAGTVNEAAYLYDSTGGRRFWPVECGSTRLSELERDKDQLLAEAVHRLRAGELWWLDGPELTAEADCAQRQRIQEDAWDERITEHVAGRDFVTVRDILSSCLEIPVGLQAQVHLNRVAHCLQRLNFKRVQRSVDGKVKWGYVPRDREPTSC